MQYIIDRLKEPSTYVGIISALGALLSWKIAPEQAAAISTGLATIVGLLMAGQKAHGAD